MLLEAECKAHKTPSCQYFCASDAITTFCKGDQSEITVLLIIDPSDNTSSFGNLPIQKFLGDLKHFRIRAGTQFSCKFPKCSWAPDYSWT